MTRMSLDPLLPGELRDDHDGRRTARDWMVDGLMYLVALTLSAVALADSWDEHSTALKVVDLTLGAAAYVALWWRRRHPGPLGVGLTLAAVLSAAAAGPAVIAGFNVALRGSRRALLTVLAVTAVTLPLFPLIYPPSDGYVLSLIIGVLLTAVVVGWGLFIRARRELVFSLRERAARLEAEQALRVEQAREAERRRIAREMHDVLAHRVSLLTLHAGALEFRPDASPEEVAEAASVIRGTAHAALEELRGVIGVLRDGEGGGGPEPPQPTLADIPALVEESRAAGMKVEASLADPPGPVPDALGRTAYRVVQEGLTNARKHAPAAAVAVHVGPDADGALVVQVISRRPLGVAAGATPAAPGHRQRADRARRAGGAGRRRAAPRAGRRRRLRPAGDAAGMSIRVLLVDDDPLVRSGLRLLLAGADSLEVVGEADDGRGVLAAVDRHRPDVVLMDIRMPQLDGIEATRLVRAQPDPPAVIVLTTFDADERRAAPRCAPARPGSCSRTRRRPSSCARSSSSTPATRCSRRP